MPKHIAVTDEKGEARFDVPPGIYTFSVEAEGFEPVRKTAEIGRDETKVTVTLRSITKGYIAIDNVRLRGLIRASTNFWEIGKCVKESERLVALSSTKLKKFAAKQFEKTTRLAQSRIESLRKTESSASVSLGLKGVSFSKSEKKHV